MLASYSLGLNPAGQVWNHVKSNGVGRKTIFGPDQMKATVIGVLRSLQRLPKVTFQTSGLFIHYRITMSKYLCSY